MEYSTDNADKKITQSAANNSNEKVVQNKARKLADNRPASTLQKKANDTGLPDNVKSGIENLSGHSLDDVKVHYNSNKPEQLNAHAYAQGSDIHLASGQEKHLPHEAWHVVQQKQGRVKPTLQMKGKVNVNDDKGLESEADIMGTKALQFVSNNSKYVVQRKVQPKTNELPVQTIQLMKKWTKEGGFENIEQVPLGEKGDWLKYKYKGEETYINSKDMEHFQDWGDIETYDDESEENTDLDVSEKTQAEDKFPAFKEGEVTSITIIKESRSDHQYVIAMVKGGAGNLKMHYGTGGGLLTQNSDIDNEHGVPVSKFDPPKGLTGNQVIAIFETTKEEIQKKFTGGNCGGLASELVSHLKGIPKKGNDSLDLFL